MLLNLVLPTTGVLAVHSPGHTEADIQMNATDSIGTFYLHH